MNPVRLDFDVTEHLPPEVTGGGRIHIAARLFIPKQLPETGRVSVISLVPGGGYDWWYYHAIFPGRAGYSMAAHLAGKGNVVLVLDHLGIGDSSRAADEKTATRQIVAAAHHAALVQAYERIFEGRLDPGLPALEHVRKIGGGHSMGGMVTITQQAQNETFDAVAVLGYTAVGVHLHTEEGHVRVARGGYDPNAPSYRATDRKTRMRTFHWDDVPDDVVAGDNARAVMVPYTLSYQATAMNIVTEDAARIGVPVYICLGERDVSPDPHAEPGYYRSSPDVTLHILPRAGHCHNFASARHTMWDRLDVWARSVVP